MFWLLVSAFVFIHCKMKPLERL
jgi:hypothetical protein